MKLANVIIGVGAVLAGYVADCFAAAVLAIAASGTVAFALRVAPCSTVSPLRASIDYRGRTIMANAAETRPWQPHERNYSGGRFGVWFDAEWTMLRVEAGAADVTASIHKHEAYDLAQRLSPPLVERVEYLFKEMKKAQAALHQFTWADTLSPLLRKIADEWDCDSSQCDYASSDLGALVCPCMDDERGCRAVEADELRQFADALEVAAKLRAQPDDIATALLSGDMLGFATAQGIEARQGGDGTAPREARKPDPKGCAHD